MTKPSTSVQKQLLVTVWRCTHFVQHLAELVGGAFLGRCGRIAAILAVLWATMGLAVRPSTWTKPVRAVFARQLLFTAVDSIPASLRFAAAFGILLIVQAAIWIDMIGISTEVVAPLLWQLIVREIAPLLACMVVIGRSGVAIGTELATMRAGGEIEVIDSQGVDPMTYLVMPRVLAVTSSVFCLATVMAVTMIVTGYMVGWSMDVLLMPWNDFFAEILYNSSLEDAVFFASKTLFAGGFAGAICCIGGMSVRSAVTEVPLVSSRVGIQSLTAVFVVSAILSILFYGKFLIFKFG